MKKKLNLISPILLIISSLILIYTYYKSEIIWDGTRSQFYFKYYVFSFVLIFLSLISFFLSNKIKTNLTTIIISIVLSLYIIEGYLVFSKKDPGKNIELKKKIYKEKSGKEFDTRTRLDVFKELKKENPNVVLAVPPFVYLFDNNKKIFPLSGISSSKTIDCNENGYYSIYQSDRSGFNNPDEEWDKEEIEFLLVGDSYTHGECVNRPNDIASVLRDLTKKGILNLAHIGNGPLMEYATLREYLASKKVKNVLWMYYEGNDLTDLNNELQDPILVKYLNNLEFSQDLILKQDIINSSGKIKINHEIDRQNKKQIENIFSFLKLSLIRNNFIFKNQHETLPQEKFKEILYLSNELVRKNNSNFYFVYLPDYYRYENKEYDNSNYNKVIQIINDLKIPLIDIRLEVFENHKDPLSLFPFGVFGHYNVQGYKLIAEYIFQDFK